MGNEHSQYSLGDEIISPSETYKLRRKLGSGTFGVVWKAAVVGKPGLHVAIKEPTQESTITSVQTEIQNLKALSNPPKPRVPRFIEDIPRKGLLPLIVMEYVHGKEPDWSKPLSEDEALVFLYKCLKTLHLVHPKMLHRDLKPNNIILHRDTHEPWIVDFGCAKDTDLAREGDNTIVGTQGFRAPEVHSKKVWPCSDIYSLGATVLVLTGPLDPQLRLWGDVVPTRNFSKTFSTILDKMVQHEHVDRFQSAAEILRLLKPLQPKRHGAFATGMDHLQCFKIPDAIRCLEQAALQKYPPAYVVLFRLFDAGLGALKIDEQKRYLYCTKSVGSFDYLLRKVTTKKHPKPHSHFILGYCYSYGLGVPKNPELSFKQFQLAADAGHALAQFNVAICLDQGIGEAKDETIAHSFYALSAKQGYARAQCNLAFCFETGKGGVKDVDEAFRWYKKAAQQGHPRAHYNLGLCYRHGIGTKKNEAMAQRLFKEAIKRGYSEALKNYKIGAVQGDPEAQFKLATCYDTGVGQETNKHEAAYYYQQAADAGHVRSQYNMGLCYYNGVGVLKDENLAFGYFEMAAQQGHIKAQFNLAVCYEHGRGVLKDHSLAKRYYQEAASRHRSLKA